MHRYVARLTQVPALQKSVGLHGPWSDVVAHYVRSGALLFHADAGARAPAESWHLACESMQSALGAFLRYFGTLAPGRWALPVLYALLRDLRWVAQGADDAATSAALAENEQALPVQKHMEECARQLNKAFSACIADRHPALSQSKKWGTYAIVGKIFRMYFRLKSTALCKNILRALAAADLPPLHRFPKGDRVTFQYYVGRLAFLDEDYAKAEKELSEALALAPKRHAHNCERILLYLIAVRLLQGVRPSPRLFASYPRLAALYAPIVEACWRGDVRRFDDVLAAPQMERTLVRLGLFLALERAREVCMTRLFRGVWRASERSTRLRLGLFTDAMHWLQLPLAPQETEWAIATLIAKGRMKGYIAHERQMLVLSASDPFPAASLAMLT